MITFKRTTPVEEQFLTLKETKDFLKVDFDFDDDLICAEIESSVPVLESALRMPIYTGEYTMDISLQNLNEYDYSKLDPYLNFKHIKVESVDSVEVYDIYGVATVLTEGADEDYVYVADTNRLYFPSKKQLPALTRDHMVIKGVFGWYANEIPKEFKGAMKNIVAHNYENRGLDMPLPSAVFDPVAQYKRWY